MIKGVLFDMDGVLVVSEPLINAAMNEYFVEHHRVEITEAHMEPLVGTGEIYSIEYLAEKFDLDIPEPAKALVDIYDRYFILLDQQSVAAKGGQQLIKDLLADGIKVAVASSGQPNKVDANLRHIGFVRDELDAVKDGASVEKLKPAPDIFLSAAEAVGLSPHECVVIEDSLNGILGAKAAGCKTIGITTTFKPTDFYEIDTDQVIDCLTELNLGLLKKL